MSRTGSFFIDRHSSTVSLVPRYMRCTARYRLVFFSDGCSEGIRRRSQYHVPDDRAYSMTDTPSEHVYENQSAA